MVEVVVEAIYPEHSFGSVSVPIWQYNVIRKFSQHRKYRVLLWEFGPSLHIFFVRDFFKEKASLQRDKKFNYLLSLNRKKCPTF
ncbi:hypothetical protein IC220_05885 [Wolbachia endosymbiont of Pentalonia nigronervosa]|nr:hypothetical protein [Wolbachia endosymbiont of Pentalonia nigronervosa]